MLTTLWTYPIHGRWDLHELLCYNAYPLLYMCLFSFTVVGGIIDHIDYVTGIGNCSREQ